MDKHKGQEIEPISGNKQIKICITLSKEHELKSVRQKIEVEVYKILTYNAVFIEIYQSPC